MNFQYGWIINIQSKLVKKQQWTDINLESKSFIDYSNYLVRAINESKSPLILGGNGVRLSGSKNKFNKFVNTTKIPTTLSWSGIDLLDNDNSGDISIEEFRKGCLKSVSKSWAMFQYRFLGVRFV